MKNVFWDGFLDELEKLGERGSWPDLDRAMKDRASASSPGGRYEATTRMYEAADRYSAEQLAEYDKSEFGKKHPRPKKAKPSGGKVGVALKKVLRRGK